MPIAKIIKNYFQTTTEVLCVYLFGSFAAGKENKMSDVDLGVIFDEKIIKEDFGDKVLDYIADLSELSKREVDVVALNSAFPFLKFQILKSGQRIYEREGREDHCFEVKAINEYFDYLPYRQRMEKAIINKIRNS